MPILSEKHLRLFPPLPRAAILGDVLLFETLLADFDAQTPYRAWRPIEWACRYGQLEVVRFLLENGSDGRVTPDDDVFYEAVQGPIHLAVASGSLPLVELLRLRGVPLDESDLYNATPLHYARSARMAHFLMPWFLHQKPYGIEPENIEGLTPLHYAASHGRSRVVRCLLEAGANPRHNACEAACTPLHRAARKRFLPSCRLLLEAGADINALDLDERTALDETLTHAFHCGSSRHIGLGVFIAWMLKRGARATRFSLHQIAELVEESKTRSGAEKWV